MKSVEERILSRKDLFVQMWNDNETSEAIASIFCVSGTTVNQWGKRLGLPRRYLGAQYRPFPELSQDEIKERCEEIRANWDAETEFNRRVQRPVEFCVSRLTWTNEGFADAGPADSHPMINTEMMNKLMKESGNARQLHSGFYKESA